MIHLGVYGTLLDPEVRALVFGETWRNAGRPARLSGWERCYVDGEAYPGIRRSDGAAINVLVLEDVPPEALAIADAFEGEDYRRETLNVSPDDAPGYALNAAFYVPTAAIALSNIPWRYDDEWRGRHRAAFLAEARAAVAGGAAVVRR